MPPKNLKFHSLPGKIMYGKKKKKFVLEMSERLKMKIKCTMLFIFPTLKDFL